MRPCYRSIQYLRLLEIIRTLELPKNPEIKKRGTIIDTTLTIGKLKMQLVIR